MTGAEYNRKKVIASSAAATILLALILYSAAIILIGNIKDIVINQAAAEAKGIAATAARFIEENVSDYTKLSEVADYSEENYDSNYYLKICHRPLAPGKVLPAAGERT